MAQLNDIVLLVPFNCADLATQELKRFAGPEAELRGQRGSVVLARGSLETAYRLCLWSRIASRVLWALERHELRQWQGDLERLGDALYAAATTIQWTRHISGSATYALNVTCNVPQANLLYLRQRLTDAVSDSFRATNQPPPATDGKATLRFSIHVESLAPAADSRGPEPDGQQEAELPTRLGLNLYLDLAGESLHRRRHQNFAASQSHSAPAGEAPLKESLAAALLLRAQAEWAAPGEESEAPQSAPHLLPAPVVDPMCGSGTLLLEALGLLLQAAPAVHRIDLASTAWPGHDADLWRRLVSEARARQEEAEERYRSGPTLVFGFDRDAQQISRAKTLVQDAGWGDFAQLEQREVASLTPPPPSTTDTEEQQGKGKQRPAGTANGVGRPGLLVCNPPYGARLSSVALLPALYRQLGRRIQHHFAGWRVALLLPATDQDPWTDFVGLPLLRQHPAKNGALDVFITRFKPITKSAAQHGDDFRNRLRKRHKRLRAWLKQQQLSCYRLYDRDLPEYAACIDIYGDAAHLQAFAPPATVEPRLAAARVRDMLDALCSAEVVSTLAIDPNKVFFKQRRRQRGHSQYEKTGSRPGTTPRWAEEHGPHVDYAKEGGYEFEINLNDYLDSGLFLDHRFTRALVGKHAADKSFLNLFCYTSSATVYAAKAGARWSESWDMSKPYLDWSARNFERNGINPHHHRLRQVDCIEELRRRPSAADKFDLIFVDPPTFSNSKRMVDTFDIQRDHAELLRLCRGCLEAGGKILFSNNLRRFSIDSSLAEEFHIEDITQKTVPRDFDKRPPHRSFWLRPKH